MHYRIATAKDAPSLAALNRQLIIDEGHRNPMTLQQLEQRMSTFLSTDYHAAADCTNCLSAPPRFPKRKIIFPLAIR